MPCEQAGTVRGLWGVSPDDKLVPTPELPFEPSPQSPPLHVSARLRRWSHVPAFLCALYLKSGQFCVVSVWSNFTSSCAQGTPCTFVCAIYDW